MTCAICWGRCSLIGLLVVMSVVVVLVLLLISFTAHTIFPTLRVRAVSFSETSALTYLSILMIQEITEKSKLSIA